MKLVGYDMTKEAAKRVYEQSGFGPESVDVVELHDCFSANELITYEALGLARAGQALLAEPVRQRRRDAQTAGASDQFPVAGPHQTTATG